MNRPVGVTILAVIVIIYGIFSLLLAFLALVGIAIVASGASALSSRLAASSNDVGTLAYAAVSDAILGVLYLAFGIGALRLKGWAWTVGVIVLVLDIVRHIVGDFINSAFGAISIISTVIAILLLVYLFLPNVRAAFGKATQPSHL